MKLYKEYKALDLPSIAGDIQRRWKEEKTFEKSTGGRPKAPPFVFYEGPPSANGLPGIHHVMSRTIKDVFCRYKTMQGFLVERKAGWDTHGLPIELSVEKELGITKEDIGKKISIEAYNDKCREAVMRYTAEWRKVTEEMGYWVDMDHPYITYENKYIESVWHLLKKLFDKKLLYKGYSIQPYSPKAGTGLSTHELNQPGTYRNIKDTTVTAQFRAVRNSASEKLFVKAQGDVCFLSWTTTPWTLPSNAALAVGEKIAYCQVNTFNQYTRKAVSVILASNALPAYFREEDKSDDLSIDDEGNKFPWKKVADYQGSDLTGIHYEQLLTYVQPLENAGNAFRVIPGDIVNTDEGTGIVHIAPTFGADDMRVAAKAGIPSILVEDESGRRGPLVDLRGRFVKEVTDFAGEYVREEYLGDAEKGKDYKSVDVRIAIRLKQENKAFRVARYEHAYPHCWRTDKPILYYPLDSWFVRTTAAKDDLIRLNNTINWKPKSTGTGRFGTWLENLQDWNLSRSRFWGIPLPVWVSEDRSEMKCIGSVAELSAACAESVKAGFMKSNPLENFKEGDMGEANYNLLSLHRPFVDDIILVSSKGSPMTRESDLIDVWFDSGSMPYAQWHYPFENKEKFESFFPADFIAEGVDQTRGWFFTLHAIATMCFGSVAFRNVVSNGLVLDKNGQKMSKRLGNTVDPFKTIGKYGPDALRWYLMWNSAPWENLRFDESGITEVLRKFFGTLYNTYAFFALYANVDGFRYSPENRQEENHRELDRWIISRLNTTIKTADESLADYDPTRAVRAIQDFVTEDLSNWYVRLSRRIFWKGEQSPEKNAAYATLFECLEKIARISAPFAPFYMDHLYSDLLEGSGRGRENSVHLAAFPKAESEKTDVRLEEKMEMAQRITSLVLSLRKKEQLKVRQPLRKMMVPARNDEHRRMLEEVAPLILSEVNIKTIEFLDESNDILVRKVKANFRNIGPKYGKLMKEISARLDSLSPAEISSATATGQLEFSIGDSTVILGKGDFEVISRDIPGLLVASDDRVTVAIDVSLDENLIQEGIARDLVNRIQNFRKSLGLEVTDRINLKIARHKALDEAIKNNKKYICGEILADTLELVESAEGTLTLDLGDNIVTKIQLDKVS